MNQSESVLESPDMASRKNNPRRLYLASNSPRRRELFALFGWEYEILPAQVDEAPMPDEDGVAYVQRLAESKASIAADQVNANGVIIAADTTVVGCLGDKESTIFGKPRNPGEAWEILRSLRGHSHQVHTAITVLSKPEGSLISDLCTTDVRMRDYTDQEIEKYIASGDPMDKAGAYAIQHAGFHPVEKLDGCFANVMGLPLCHLTRSLFKLGITPPEDVPQACQTALNYHCPVFEQIFKQVQDYTLV